MAYTSQQNTILQNMISYMQNPNNWADKTPKITDFSSGSVICTLLSAISVAVDTNGMAIYMARQAAYISSATGNDLDNKAADYGITRKAAEAASNPFTLIKLTPTIEPTPIVKGSLISTLPDSNGTVITFVTTEDGVLPAGQTQVNVVATCQTAGTIGNLAANTALLVSSPVPGIDGVVLTSDIRNGIAVESDDSLKTRTLNAFASLAIGTLAWYEQTALNIQGVQSATAIPQNRGAGTVDVFIVGENNTIPSSDLQAEVQTALDSGRPVTDDAKQQTPTELVINAAVQIHLLTGAKAPDPAVAKTSVQTAITNYINNLGVAAGGLNYVYASQLIAVAMSVTGVVNAQTTFTDLQVSQYQLSQAGIITVTTF